MVNCNYVLLVISYTLLNAHIIRTDTCQENKTSFSISTRRNVTGHWIFEVTMDLHTDEYIDVDKRLTGASKLGVSLYKKRCDGKESLSIVTAITVPPPKPGLDYELFPGVGYYKFHTSLKTWDDARRTCATEGGHLAILNSDTESDIAKQLFSRHKHLAAWAFIGFHDRNAEGKYITIFDEPLTSTGFAKWRGGMPDNFGGNQNNESGEDCGTIDHDGKLNDYPCSAKSPFICEHEL